MGLILSFMHVENLILHPNAIAYCEQSDLCKAGENFMTCRRTSETSERFSPGTNQARTKFVALRG